MAVALFLGAAACVWMSGSALTPTPTSADRPATPVRMLTVATAARPSESRGPVDAQDAGPFVCLVGNSESLANARRVHAMWGGSLPSYWYIWKPAEGALADDLSPVPVGLRVAARARDSGAALAFTQGLELAIAAAQAEHGRCTYYFLHDDDLEFKSQTGMPIEETLLKNLRSYRPAVAGFPWTAGYAKNPSLKALHDHYAAQEVAPLTGFDNGMVLFHHTILDMFCPFHPHGEGGFVSRWTLGAHFLQLFVPLALGPAALCLLQLSYVNTINLDALPRKVRHRRQVKGSLVYHEGVRHPYEYVPTGYMEVATSIAHPHPPSPACGLPPAHVLAGPPPL